MAGDLESNSSDNNNEIDKKTNSMITLIQEDGDTFAQRAEMYYKRRPELVKMVEDLCRSYRSLAERYHQLKSEQPSLALRSNSSLSNASTKQHLQRSRVLEAPELPKETSDTLAQLEFHVALLEDHLKQHGELIRRNEEKREIIRELRLEQQRMSEEIRALKSCASRETIVSRRRSNASHVSRLKGLFFGRLSVDK
ncbi:hypothetical protein QJS10_CPA16g00842 [Acorus calamus]|uniref:NAB domain-containing protein n=1 Tax=Acorus calamus TaxID=4465 RepID=A0AAV9D169_ACOCL|nr:hypothetical protein QJS10_CPA16g00842 [Acorus calamus]